MTTYFKSFYGEKNREIALVLLLSFRILTSTDDKDDNDITEPERDDDRLFDLFFDGERLRDLVLWRPRLRLDFFPAKTTSEAAEAATKSSGTTSRSAERFLALFDELSIFNNVV